jgi:hypothetical protein
MHIFKIYDLLKCTTCSLTGPLAFTCILFSMFSYIRAAKQASTTIGTGRFQMGEGILVTEN